MTRVSRYRIPKMDCAAEEQMVRDALDEIAGIRKLDFDLPGRRLAVYHDVEAASISQMLDRLGLGATPETSEETAQDVPAKTAHDDRLESRTLQILLAINGTMFVVEQVAG